MISRAAAVALAGIACLAALAPPAGAVGGFHFIKIREVSIGGGNPSSAFVELQIYAPDQANIAGHTITFYDELGVSIGPYVLGSDVPNGDNQRSILVGEPGVGPDFPHAFGSATSSLGGGGAVCFDNLDCISWGSFAAAGSLPSPAGAPAPAIPNGSSLERSIAPGCPTLLEDFDDTDVSAADLFLQPVPNPRNNSTPPTEQSCSGPPSNIGGGPDTRIDKGPKKKTRRKRAVFKFSSSSVGVTFECSLDDKAPKGAAAYGPCNSPLAVKVKRGKHTFRVRAVLNGVPDGSPAQQTWKVRKR